MTMAFLLALLVSPWIAGVVAHPPPPRAGLSWDDADALDAKLELLDKRQRSGRAAHAETVEVTEDQLNSYVNLKLQIPDGVTDLVVRLDRDRVELAATVDLDRLQVKLPSTSAWNPLSLLSGRVPVSLKGKLVNKDDGFASFGVDEVRLGAFPIPTTVLAQLVLTASRNPNNPQGVDILSPFRLPFSMKHVRLQPGRAFLDF